MSVNLMEGRLDGDENESNQNNSGNKINLELEKSSKTETKKVEPVKVTVPSKAEVESKVGETGKVKEIKVKTESTGVPKVPEDINIEASSEDTDGGVSKVVIGVILLLVVGTGVLLYLLNSESQFLKGSVNELPTSDSTQIVDDILAEDFNNSAEESTDTTDIVVDNSDIETEQEMVNDNASSDNETVVDDSPASEDTEELNVVDNSQEDVLPSTETNEETQLEDEILVVNPSAETEQDISSQNEVNNEATTDNSNPEDIIANYELQNSAETTENLIDENNNTETDFTPETEQSNQTVSAEVTESDEIQGDTGPGLWISVIVATLLNFAYGRKDKILNRS